jgi:hypothetical protein
MVEWTVSTTFIVQDVHRFWSKQLIMMKAQFYLKIKKNQT